MAGIDPSMYGGTDLPEEFQSEFPSNPLPPATEVAQAVPAGTGLERTSPALEGRGVLAEANREKAPVLASIGAGFMLSDTASAYAWMSAPEFVPEQGHSNLANFNALDFTITPEQYGFLNKAQSQDEWVWREQRVRNLNEASGVAGDNPLAAALPMLLDPAYIGADVMTLGAARVLRAGRFTAGGLAAAGAAGISSVAAEANPVVDMETAVVAALVNGAAVATLYRGGKLVPSDPDFPSGELQDSVRDATKPKVRRAADGSWERVPETPRPSTPEAAVEAVQRGWAKRAGDTLQINMRKQMAGFGEVGRRVANLLYDNNSDLSLTSVEAQRRAVRADLTRSQRLFEDSLKEGLRDLGIGLKERVLHPMRSMHRQTELLKEVQLEMFRREQFTRQGLTPPTEGLNPIARRMADRLDEISAKSLKELKAAGVEGAEEVVARAGWHHRQWSVTAIEAAEQRFIRAGRTAKQADQAVKRLLATALRRANNWDDELGYDVAAAIINRTKRKGYFEDAAFNTHQGIGTVKQVRDILSEEGLSGPRLERVLEVLEGRNAEAAKPGFLKRRMDLDYKATVHVNGETIRVTDLIDPNLVAITDKYLDGVSSQVAWARSGYSNPVAIDKLRTELLQSIPEAHKRVQAKELFDNTVAFLSGNPAGERVGEGMRAMMSFGRMVALSNSGLWQITEYPTILARYGLVKSTKHFIKAMPGFRKLWNDAASDPLTSSRLQDVLTRHSTQDIRIRPFVTRFEDNYEMPTSARAQLALSQAEQLVPYVNAMKYVQHHQARMTANLITDRLAQAAKGNAEAVQALQKYGIESRVMDELSREVKQFGMDTSKWSDSVWAGVRPAFSKMMDEAVLHQRLGDTPAFAKFDKVGKFLFTYRSFMLTAHNKVLAGGLAREGAGGVGLLLLYQFPLAMLAVRAQVGLQGKEAPDMDELAMKAIGQMGGIGVFSELWGAATGIKSEFGSPGLIPVDRLYSTAGDLAQGNFASAGSTALQSIPILGLLPPIKALSNLD